MLWLSRVTWRWQSNSYQCATEQLSPLWEAPQQYQIKITFYSKARIFPWFRQSVLATQKGDSVSHEGFDSLVEVLKSSMYQYHLWFFSVWLQWGSWGIKRFAISFVLISFPVHWEESEAQSCITKTECWTDVGTWLSQRIYCLVLRKMVKPAGPQFLCQRNGENRACSLHHHSPCGCARCAWMRSRTFFRRNKIIPYSGLHAFYQIVTVVKMSMLKSTTY